MTGTFTIVTRSIHYRHTDDIPSHDARVSVPDHWTRETVYALPDRALTIGGITLPVNPDMA